MELAYSIGSWMSAGGMIILPLLLFFLMAIDEFFVSLDSLGETFDVAAVTMLIISILIVFIGIGTLGLTGLVDLCM